MSAHHPASDRWTFVGFGEAAAALVAAGFPRMATTEVLLTSDREPSAATRRRLAASGLPSSSDPSSVRNARVVLSLVTPSAALDAARSLAPFLRRGAFYVDFNSVAGKTATDIAVIVEARGAHFVDAAIMGPVPLMKLAVPILVSGTAAREFHHLAGLQGLTTTVLSSQAGDASSLKMLWSVMTKGTIALLAESLTAAHRLGLLEPLLGLIGQEYGNTGTPAMVMRMLRSTAASGDRRLVEMQEARRTLDGAAVPSWAVEATMRWIAALNGMPGVADGQTVPEVVRAASDALGALADTTTTPSS